MNTELAEIIEDCVKSALDAMGDEIHQLSLFCTVEEKSIFDKNQ